MDELVEKMKYHISMAEEHEAEALKCPDSQMQERIWHDVRANSHRLRALCIGISMQSLVLQGALGVTID